MYSFFIKGDVKSALLKRSFTMKEEFEIYGTHIPFSSIKDYRVVQREYIYRPHFREKPSSFIRLSSTPKYEYFEMVPYAAIISENEYNAAMKAENNNNSIIQDESAKNPSEIVADVCMDPVNFVKDVTVNAFSSLFNKSRFNKQQSNIYFCLNPSGRVFKTRIEDVPIIVSKINGQVFDVTKNDPLYTQLGNDGKAFINEVTAFIIEANKKYLFFGDSIQLDDANREYARLRYEFDEYKRSLNYGIEQT